MSMPTHFLKPTHITQTGHRLGSDIAMSLRAVQALEVP
jgi:queuine/archaeosine tRNA-ribosyltransferase